MAAPSTANVPRIVVIGAGGHGRVVLDILLARAEHDVVGFLDSNVEVHGRRIDGVPVLGDLDRLATLRDEMGLNGAIVAIGDNGVRRGFARRVEQCGLSLIRAIHPTACIAHNAHIGRNTVIAAGVVVCANCQVGDSAILNTGCIVDHQTLIGEGVHVCPGVRIAGRVTIEAGAFLGIGATVVPNVRIGCEAIVGAGSVVVDDVPPLATVVGVPARSIRQAAAGEDLAAMLLPLNASLS